MIGLDTARALLDLGTTRVAAHRAEEQLRGAVALHAMLSEHGVAYLADEVGMGKTYVALATLALFRHFDPTFRALVIAPRENIQKKWQKELGNFVRHNVRVADLRLKGMDGHPARPMVRVESLVDLVHEVGVDPDRDFFARMTSFSVGLGAHADDWRKARSALLRELPWLPPHALEAKDRRTFKDRLATAVCCALPEFDLVIVDEAHNLKHGYGRHVSARNRTMARVFGRDDGDVDKTLFRAFAPRAKRVLFLSATPIEDDYAQLHKQLDVFGRAAPFDLLADADASSEEKKALLRSILVRRVTSMQVGDETLTKNQYRLEWRHGGVRAHDEPIGVASERERLVVALMQKKVSELTGRDRFNTSFQTGMLASFESFGETLQTTLAARPEDESALPSNFDADEQTADADEREGIDVSVVNRIARSYRTRFGGELPHPKMNALVDSLDDAWSTGTKALVFVRRVRSVYEIKRRLDDRYDMWLLEALLTRLPERMRAELREHFATFTQEKQRLRNENQDAIHGTPVGGATSLDDDQPDDTARAEDDDHGDNDTFFAYFMRGRGLEGVLSGGAITERFRRGSGALSTFFEDNFVADLLDVEVGAVLPALAEKLDLSQDTLHKCIAKESTPFLGDAKKVNRARGFEAAQAAALVLLGARKDELGAVARHVLQSRFPERKRSGPHAVLDPNIARWLELPTFFSELRSYHALRAEIWPKLSEERSWRDRVHEQTLRAQLLSAAARLGHAFIDLYCFLLTEAGGFRVGQREEQEEDLAVSDGERIHRFLEMLEAQRTGRASASGFAAFHELAAIAGSFDAIVDLNAPKAREAPLSLSHRIFASLLSRQKPVVGVVGGARTDAASSQFRMPGYPLVLIATDVLQEGEDLHTFCSRVHHYGIGFTPSSTEQRIGRLDRVGSQTDRRLAALSRPVAPDEKLAVFYPHLDDTVESIQVRRLLHRMDRFLRMMHEGLLLNDAGDSRVDVARAILDAPTYPTPITEMLRTSFEIDPVRVPSGGSALAVGEADMKASRRRFDALGTAPLGELHVAWHPREDDGPWLGTARLDERTQPFALYLRSFHDALCIRCVSPIGHLDIAANGLEKVLEEATRHPVPVAAVVGAKPGSYDLSVEDDVLLGADASFDSARVSWLIRRVATAADALERELLAGADAPMETFAEALLAEGRASV